ncbi:MAG: hypothetical protein HFI87_06855 [Bacilli bacterium]|nr:hypothetical protein [Bacilli bacterium]
MNLKKNLIWSMISLCAIGCFTGCTSDNAEVEEKKEDETKGNCVVIECIKQLKPSNSVEEINDIIGFEGTKSDYSDERTWKLDSKNWITLKYAGDSPILQATIDKESIKNENIKLPASSELQKMLNNGSFTYEELVSKLNGIEGTLSSKTNGSVSYIWVDKNKRVLSATFNNESGKCTIASFR